MRETTENDDSKTNDEGQRRTRTRKCVKLDSVRVLDWNRYECLILESIRVNTE